MKRIKLTIDNQEFELDVDEKQLKNITDKLVVSRNGYEQSTQGFYVSAKDEVFEVPNTGDSGYALWEVGNYYSNRKFAEDCARADRLMRNLRRFSVEHRTKNIKQCSEKYLIQYDIRTGTIAPVDFEHGYAGAVLFDTKECCAEAIQEYYNTLVWYFEKFSDTTQKLYL